MNRFALATALTLVLSAPLAVARADVPDSRAEPPSARVTFDRLALGRPANDAALQADLRRAARHVCGGYNRTTLADRVQFDACYAQALEGAQRQLDAARGYASTVSRTPSGS